MSKPANSISPPPPPRRTGGGYVIGPRKPVPAPDDAKYLTSNQVRARYGNRSAMWLYRKNRHDPVFPKPFYFGRMQMFLVADLDAYDATLIQRRSA
jgi:hypothetical protein